MEDAEALSPCFCQLYKSCLTSNFFFSHQHHVCLSARQESYVLDRIIYTQALFAVALHVLYHLCHFSNYCHHISCCKFSGSPVTLRKSKTFVSNLECCSRVIVSTLNDREQMMCW